VYTIVHEHFESVFNAVSASVAILRGFSEYYIDYLLFTNYDLLMTASQRTTDFNEETRQLILDAAFERFGHYGYNKTTMVEIAQDVGMSAANLYRYFENKQEITEYNKMNLSCQDQM